MHISSPKYRCRYCTVLGKPPLSIVRIDLGAEPIRPRRIVTNSTLSSISRLKILYLIRTEAFPRYKDLGDIICTNLQHGVHRSVPCACCIDGVRTIPLSYTGPRARQRRSDSNEGPLASTLIVPAAIQSCLHLQATQPRTRPDERWIGLIHHPLEIVLYR